VVGAVILAAAAASGLLVAVVDAVTLRSRLIDEIATARPLWLHTFGIALLTAVAGVTRLLDDRPFGRMGRVACVVLAGLNLTVPLLERGRPDLGPVLSWVHATLAVLLVVLALDRPDHRRDRALSTSRRHPLSARRFAAHARH